MELKKIVVGVDGSPAAAAALRWAADTVGDDGEILAVHGTATALIAQAAASAATGMGAFPELEGRRDEAQRMLEGPWREPVRDRGVAYRAVALDGDPVDAILETARRYGADAIVVGHQGPTGLLQRLFRGVLEGLVDEARRPVVAIPFGHDREVRSARTDG
jgi:nucleotide-binding universal stress UspA family protein